jgi:uncharacterized repeat protein (TIGR01451 family)
VSVPPGATDPVPTNNSISDVILVLAMPDTAVLKIGPTNVAGSTNFAYTITVSNHGPGAASNVVARDVLPAGLTFVSASGGGSVDSGVATWTLQTLAAGASTNVILTVRAPWAGGLFTNVASIEASTPALNPGNNTSAPVLTTVAPGPATAGQLAIAGEDVAGAHLLWYGPDSGAFSIEATTNLPASEWVVTTNFISTNGVMMFIDPTATNYPDRFYRAKAGG